MQIINLVFKKNKKNKIINNNYNANNKQELNIKKEK